jgi:uncharacterized membrane protein YqaE (UPF0057 family)
MTSPAEPLADRRTMDVLRIVLAILLPPLGVFLQVGLRGQFWLNVLLTLLGYVPGIIHAVWVISRYK